MNVSFDFVNSVSYNVMHTISYDVIQSIVVAESSKIWFSYLLLEKNYKRKHSVTIEELTCGFLKMH